MIVLDTDVISELMRRSPSAGLIQRLAATPVDEQATTSITLGEIAFGAAKARRPELYDRALTILRQVWVLDFDAAAARLYGVTRADLERRGVTLDDADLRIAAIVLAYGDREPTLVTGNTKHFDRVADLRVADWIRS